MGFLYSQLFVTPQLQAGTDFSGQTVIVTGANSGLGKDAARHIAGLGASKVILAVRNVRAGEEARQDIIKTTKCATSVVEVWELDLSSFESVKKFAEKVDTLPRLDVLLENAGISTAVYSVAEGYERTITVNVISTYLLLLLILPKLKAQAKEHAITPRISIVSSDTHAMPKYKEQHSKDIFATLSDSATCDMGERYWTSKLQQILLVREFAPKLVASGVVINTVNPGLCESGLSRDGPFHITSIIWAIAKFFLARTQEVGSRTLVNGAAGGFESHGQYMTDGKVDYEALSAFVRSEDGVKAGTELWRQLQPILEGIAPGVTKNL